VILSREEHWKYHYLPIHSAIAGRGTMGFDLLGCFQPVCFKPDIAYHYDPDKHGRVGRPWLFAKDAEGHIVCFIQLLLDLLEVDEEFKVFARPFNVLPPPTIDLVHVVKYGKIGWEESYISDGRDAGACSLQELRRRYVGDLGDFSRTPLAMESLRMGEGGVGNSVTIRVEDGTSHIFL
jgi:hypothetical protein